MLQSIRDKSKGWIAYLIIGFISIPFAFWGVTSYFGTGDAAPVAEVEGEEISQPYFQDLYQRRYQAEQQRQADDANIDEAALKATVLDEVVQQTLLRTWTENNGYAVSDKQLAKAIHGNFMFQEEGKFSPDQYRSILGMQGLTVLGYENRLGQSIRMNQLRSGTANSTIVASTELAQLYALENQTRDISLMQIDAKELATQVSVSEDEIAAYYADNQAAFKTDPRMKAEYIELNAADLEAEIVADEDVLKARYEETIARYTKPEERRSSHILIAKGNGVSEAEALEQAQALQAELAAGADFADLAKEHSDDPGSGAAGGDLGFTAKDGRFVPPFEEALFELEAAGDISEPVISDFGVHLIKLTELKTERVEPFADVKAQVEREYITEQANEAFRAQTDTLIDLSYKIPDSLEPAAEELGVELKTSDWFSRSSGTGIAGNADVREAAFDASVVEDGDNTDMIELGPERVIVLRRASYEPARQLELADVRGQIETLLKDDKANQLASDKAERILAQLEAGSKMSDLAAAEELSSETRLAVRRDDSELNAEVIEQAFALPKPAADASVLPNAKVALNNGRYTLISLTAVNEPSTESATEAELDALKRQIAMRRGNAEFAAVMKRMVKESDIKVFSDRL